jgi:cobyrinic acid a,c-diamide synthase
MMGRDAVLATFTRAARGADVALIEGVMGLYDGASPDTEHGSAAEVAKWLDAPVLAVVDGSGVARTLAAVGLGLAQFDPALRLVGLFANRVGSPGHLDLLRAACARHVPVVGGLPVDEALAFPERHLGLQTADREAVSDEKLDAWGVRLAEWCSPDALFALARGAPPLPECALSQAASSERCCRIAVARDAAFHFYYEDNLARLAALGAELVPFSPLADGDLPRDVHGLYIGGGYPELHAARLAENRSMRAAVSAFAASGARARPSTRNAAASCTSRAPSVARAAWSTRWSAWSRAWR